MFYFLHIYKYLKFENNFFYIKLQITTRLILYIAEKSKKKKSLYG